MKQVEVSILGQAYMLGCPDGGEALLDISVATVDREMTAIRDSRKVRARERIAVLAALNLAYQLAERGDAGAAGSAYAGGVGALQPGLDALMQRIDGALGDDGQLL